ncbi:helix-turn-helix domain-containing protein, partial [Neomicrococcus lactis]|uniref:helix-turn-helix domain-containing protein n=1 Tax=Neomicrococcus lactis TaxID=732241 RepID=UPI002301CEAD
MSTRNKAIILAVKQGSMSTRAAAQQFNVSERWVKELLSRYVREGETAFQPRSKRPKTTPNRTPEPIRERIKELREHLTQ